MVEITLVAGEVLEVPIELKNEDGTPYSVTGTAVLRIAEHWGTEAIVEETVDIVTDPDTPIVQFSDTATIDPGLYSVELWETDQPLRLAKGLLLVEAGIATVPAE